MLFLLFAFILLVVYLISTKRYYNYVSKTFVGFKDNVEGYLKHHIPDEMILQKPSSCIIRIALERLTLDLDEELKKFISQTIRVSKVMKVELLDVSKGKNFDIFSSSSIQFLEEKFYTQWLFVVTPLREGTHHLVLKTSILHNVDGEQLTKDTSFAKQIRVIVTVDKNVPFSMKSFKAKAKGAICEGLLSGIYFLENALNENSKLSNDLVLLRSQISNLNSEYEKSMITRNELRTNFNRITFALIELTDGIKMKDVQIV